MSEPAQALPGYRPGLPPVPDHMRHLPVRRGYPVPWFVAKVDGDYHFPTADGSKVAIAVKANRCWVCGGQLGTRYAFVIGPLGTVTRTTSEPPCHRECAVFSATACPFLARPGMKRQLEHAEGSSPPPGLHIERNPGASVVWITRAFSVARVPGDQGVEGGVLFKLDWPETVLWFREGRAATREEALDAIESGVPILREYAPTDDDREYLDQCLSAARKMVPA